MSSESPDFCVLVDALEMALHNGLGDVALGAEFHNIGTSSTDKKLAAGVDVDGAKTGTELQLSVEVKGRSCSERLVPDDNLSIVASCDEGVRLGSLLNGPDSIGVLSCDWL